MKKTLLLVLTTLLSITCYCQISFEKGYYIDNNNKKNTCLIRNVDWKNNPTEFEYKQAENNKSDKKTIKSVKEFGIDHTLKYVRSTVKIDRSTNNIADLGHDKNPLFKEEELFLKVLVEGEATLYEYVDGNLTRFFYNKAGANIEQLVFKTYKTKEHKVGENNRYKQQLWIDLKCANFKMSRIKNIDYKKNKLVNFFVAYNNCNNLDYVNFEEKPKRDLFNLTIRPRLNGSSLTIQNSVSDSRDTDFENKVGFGLGVEAEFILPFNKNKWSIIFEPTYQNFNKEKTTTSNDVSGGIMVTNVDYSSIEFPLGLRHYFFFDKDSKIFINAAYILDLSPNSSIEFNREDGSNINSLEITTRNNWAFGLGYKHNDKYSIELRYQTQREILGDYLVWSSEYKTLSMVLGYSLF